MPHFSLQILGEPEPRGFRYNIAEDVLETDIVDREHPLGGMDDQFVAKITAKNANSDPDYHRYWVATQSYREAYQLSENDGLSFEEALKRVQSESSNDDRVDREPELTPTQAPDVRQLKTPDKEDGRLPVEPQAQGTDPVAGVLITNQQLLLEIAFQLLAQYVPEDDANHQLVQLLKNKVDEFNEYEFTL